MIIRYGCSAAGFCFTVIVGTSAGSRRRRVPDPASANPSPTVASASDYMGSNNGCSDNLHVHNQAALKALEEKLHAAKTEYQGIIELAPDKQLIGRRIEALNELVDSLASGMDRVKADRMEKQAALRIKEATPLFQRLASRFPDAKEASEREALLDLASLARAKLGEARSLYAEVESSDKGNSRASSRVAVIDRLLEALDEALGPVTTKPGP